MARRLFNGRAFSENGWPYVDQGSCTWVMVPGSDDVWLQIQNGPPLAVLRAFAADFNAHVERLRDDDSACWTYDNKVATSNHPGGTSMDLNWNGADGRTFRYGITGEAAYPDGKLTKLRDLLMFYEDLIFCGGFWSIRDWMHMQLGSGTYDSRADKPTQKTMDFIARKIRADGFSTYKRGNAPQADDPAWLLSQATGVSLNKATEILPIVRDGLAWSECNNPKRIAMWLAQMGHESASFVYTEEIQSGDENTDRWKYKGRTWIQITWRSNYLGFSQWCFDRQLVPTQDYFVAVPKQLAELKWAARGPAWYWTVARPTLNSLSDAGNLDEVTRLINGGYNGIDDRRKRYNRALALGDRLLTLVSGGDDMAAVPQDQWDWVYNELKKQFDNRSMYGPPGDKDTLAGRVANSHAFGWDERVESSAFRGEEWAIDLVAQATKGTDPFLARHAAAVLVDVEARNPVALQRYLAQKGAAV